MDKVVLHNVQAFSSELLNTEGNYLILQNANSVPPHIGLILKNKYFSSSVAGVKTNVDLESVLKNIQLKNTPVLFIRLSDFIVMQQFASSVFMNYGPLNSAEKSCLFPIISVLNNALNIELTGEFVFEIIPELQKLNLIQQVYALNLETENDSFELKTYSRADINYCITQLNEKAAS